MGFWQTGDSDVRHRQAERIGTFVSTQRDPRELEISYDHCVKPITVLVVDDHRMVAEGLATVLGANELINVVGQAATGAAALTLSETHRPDVAVVDLRLGDTDGIALARRLLAQPWPIRIVLISADFTSDALREAAAAGVIAFASKLASADELAKVVVSAAAGTGYMSSDVVPLLTEHQTQTHPSVHLTDREREVVQALADGKSVAETATEMHLSPHTVRNHIRRAMSNLGVRRRLDAVVVAAQAGLIRLPE